MGRGRRRVRSSGGGAPGPLLNAIGRSGSARLQVPDRPMLRCASSEKRLRRRRRPWPRGVRTRAARLRRVSGVWPRPRSGVLSVVSGRRCRSRNPCRRSRFPCRPRWRSARSARPPGRDARRSWSPSRSHPAISTLPSGSGCSLNTLHSCSWRGLEPSTDRPLAFTRYRMSMISTSGISRTCGSLPVAPARVQADTVRWESARGRD